MQNGAPGLWISATGPISLHRDVEAFTRALHAEQDQPKTVRDIVRELKKGTVSYHASLAPQQPVLPS